MHKCTLLISFSQWWLTSQEEPGSAHLRIDSNRWLNRRNRSSLWLFCWFVSLFGIERNDFNSSSLCGGNWCLWMWTWPLPVALGFASSSGEGESRHTPNRQTTQHSTVRRMMKWTSQWGRVMRVIFGDDLDLARWQQEKFWIEQNKSNQS